MKDPLLPLPNGMFNGWWPKYDYPTLTKLVREGKAVSVGNDYRILLASFKHSNCIIRVHRVMTLDEYTEIVEAYRSLSKDWSFPDHSLICLFRGQSQDYYDSRRHLRSLPSVFRSAKLANEYLSMEPDTVLATDWHKWAQIIDQVTSLKDISGPLYGFSDPYQPNRKVALAPLQFDKTLSARLTTNPNIMALAMHYGFPTASLDVTPNHQVSLWFALHTTQIDEQSVIRYIANPGTQGGPSVYVYIQPISKENPTIDLMSIQALRGKADRPFIQSGWALPFYKHSSIWMGDMDAQFFMNPGPCERWPSAIIKPIFSPSELKKARSLYADSELFPSDDPLYQALIAAGSPRLARYAT